jgi:NAD+ diphosphatase
MQGLDPPAMREAHRREDSAWIAARLEDPTSRAMVFGVDSVLVARPGAAAAVTPIPSGTGGAPLLLGVDSAGAVFAVDVAGDSFEAGPGQSFQSLREFLPTCSPLEAGLAVHGASLVGWHRRHSHCPNCGAVTSSVSGGYVRECGACGTLHYPRIDPVVIMLVIDGDRVLLGRGVGWDSGLYSALAGFVEPGETLEQAVVREVVEETGLTVTNIAYQASQSWPFPSSLMIGFEATLLDGELQPGDLELEDARWLTRAEITSSAEGRGPIQLPSRSTIARHLLEQWVAR